MSAARERLRRLLSVSVAASHSTLRRAYLAEAKRLHPDSRSANAPTAPLAPSDAEAFLALQVCVAHVGRWCRATHESLNGRACMPNLAQPPSRVSLFLTQTCPGIAKREKASAHGKGECSFKAPHSAFRSLPLCRRHGSAMHRRVGCAGGSARRMTHPLLQPTASAALLRTAQKSSCRGGTLWTWRHAGSCRGPQYPEGELEESRMRRSSASITSTIRAHHLDEQIPVQVQVEKEFGV